MRLSLMTRGIRRAAAIGAATLVAVAPGTAAPAAQGLTFQPFIADWQFLGAGPTPPSEAACNAVGRRCFNPAAMAGSYNYAGLHAAGTNGAGKTIAIIDS